MDATPPAFRWLLPAFVAALTFLLYIGTLRFAFVYDDLLLILANPLVQSWHYLRTLFQTHMWAFGGPAYPANYWRPVFMVWLLVNYSLFGAHPLGWHLMAVLAHVAVALLVYALARRLTGDRISGAVAGLVFGIHPVTIEDTAWVLGATESIVGIFFLASLVMYIDARRQGSRAKLAASVALFASGLLVKETAIVLVGMIFAYVWIYQPGGRKWSDRFLAAVKPCLPYLVVTLVYFPLRMMVLKTLAPPQNPATLAAMVMTWPPLLWLYLRLLLFPVNMTLYYYLPLVTQFSLRTVLLPALPVVGAGVGLCWWARRTWEMPEAGGGELTRGRLVAFATILIVLPLLPVMYLRALIVGEFAHARYLHLSCVGLALLVAGALRHIKTGRAELFGRPAPQVAAVAALILGLGGLNASQQVYWANNLILFAHAWQKSPHSIGAMTNLGAELNSRGRFDEAIAVLNRGLQENPDSWRAHFNLGYAYVATAGWAESEKHLERSIAIDGLNAEQFAYLAVADRNLGKLERAEWAARQALQRKPNEPRYHFSLGLILEQEGKRAEAAQEYEAELALNPKDRDAREHLAAVR